MIENTIDIDFSTRVAFLSQTSSYAENPVHVERIETHMSWVFLTDCFVYKMKKPVLLDGLDLRTLEQRHQNCLDELRLNRRLARDVYLDVLALTTSRSGQLELGGRGKPVDWLVKMRRLPREQMLDTVIARRQVDESQVRRITRVLVDFYRQAEPENLTTDEYIRHFEKRIEANEAALLDPVYSLPVKTIGEVGKALRRCLSNARSVFDARIAARRIIEAHGDLRPEHICLSDPPVFIDCLEFDRRLRVMDAADELAFLSMECEIAGAPFIGPLLFESYRLYSGDDPPHLLVCFYKAHRAQLWAKLAIWHIRDHDDSETGQWTRRSMAYLRLASRFAGELQKWRPLHQAGSSTR